MLRRWNQYIYSEIKSSALKISFIPQECAKTHPYCGKADKYIDTFKDIKLPKKNTWGYGIAGY